LRNDKVLWKGSAFDGQIRSSGLTD